jgi:hypothetical protein
MAAVGIVKAADIARRLHVARHFAALDETEPLMSVVRGCVVARAAQRVEVARLVGNRDVAGHEIALDVVSGNARFHDGDCLLPHLPDAPDAVVIEVLAKFIHRAGEAADQLPTVAAARRPTDLRCLEHRDRKAALGELERCRDAGETGADDADVDCQRVHERWMSHSVVGCGGVIRGDMWLTGKPLHKRVGQIRVEDDAACAGMRRPVARKGARIGACRRTAPLIRSRVAARWRRWPLWLSRRARRFLAS